MRPALPARCGGASGWPIIFRSMTLMIRAENRRSAQAGVSSSVTTATSDTSTEPGIRILERTEVAEVIGRIRQRAEEGPGCAGTAPSKAEVDAVLKMCDSVIAIYNEAPDSDRHVYLACYGQDASVAVAVTERSARPGTRGALPVVAMAFFPADETSRDSLKAALVQKSEQDGFGGNLFFLCDPPERIAGEPGMTAGGDHDALEPARKRRRSPVCVAEQCRNRGRAIDGFAANSASCVWFRYAFRTDHDRFSTRPEGRPDSLFFHESGCLHAERRRGRRQRRLSGVGE